jgi:4-alpha-glucanotransferase
MPLPSHNRSSGILLHPTSLPGKFGIGDLGPEAYRWVETLAYARQSWWQILPLGPTGYGDSPYQAYSAFAGNIYLLSPELLLQDGLLGADWQAPDFPPERVDFERVVPMKREMVRQAWDHFAAKVSRIPAEEFEAYQQQEASWLHDFAQFMVIRDALGQKPLTDWPSDLRQRDPVALEEICKQLRKEILIHEFGQFLFDRQWAALRNFAKAKGVHILGDAPIFVAGDSADVWANPGEFLLDEVGKPLAVAGVPPDYFSEDGQLWGNPLYRWDAMARNDYAWWHARIRRQLTQVDLVRLDHFRGFAAAWHIPPQDLNARNGHWVDGPRHALFASLQKEWPDLPIVAEDLGLITPDVEELRTAFHLPGMRVVQFALSDPTNPYWPHNYEPNTVAYTGTHDNDTTLGWYRTLNPDQQARLAEYLGVPITDPAGQLLRLAWSSVAKIAIAPLQDVLNLGGEARMNIPGVGTGNWNWRVRPEQFDQAALDRLAAWTILFNRTRA